MFNTQLHGLSKPVVGYNWYTMGYYTVFKRSDTNSRGTYLIEKSSYNSTGTVWFLLSIVIYIRFYYIYF